MPTHSEVVHKVMGIGRCSIDAHPLDVVEDSNRSSLGELEGLETELDHKVACSIAILPVVPELHIQAEWLDSCQRHSAMGSRQSTAEAEESSVFVGQVEGW